MSASERFDDALNGFRRALALLDEPGHFTRTVYQRPSAGRILREVREIVRAERHEDNLEPRYDPAYFVREPSHH
jgi:hypothetical protein